MAKDDGSDTQYVFVKERTALKLATGSFVAVIFVTVFLFLLGFSMSFVGIRPPTFDGNILVDQWEKRINGAAVSYDDCVEKKGLIRETFPPTCSLGDDTFSQSLPQACKDNNEVCRLD